MVNYDAVSVCLEINTLVQVELDANKRVYDLNDACELSIQTSTESALSIKTSMLMEWNN